MDTDSSDSSESSPEESDVNELPPSTTVSQMVGDLVAVKLV